MASEVSKIAKTDREMKAEAGFLRGAMVLSSSATAPQPVFPAESSSCLGGSAITTRIVRAMSAAKQPAIKKSRRQPGRSPLSRL